MHLRNVFAVSVTLTVPLTGKKFSRSKFRGFREPGWTFSSQNLLSFVQLVFSGLHSGLVVEVLSHYLGPISITLCVWGRCIGLFCH